MSQQLVEPFDMDVFALELASVLLGAKTVRKHSMEATHRHHNLINFILVVSICQFLILLLEVPFTDCRPPMPPRAAPNHHTRRNACGSICVVGICGTQSNDRCSGNWRICGDKVRAMVVMATSYIQSNVDVMTHVDL